ncbi:hypothetical protein C2E25_00520 [Geothermobacter hydrogeniphilus]|uniref:Uncharacterized protein n=2 Tax=Geothermobacter hydrogeniphilus TaxID=1969733 RepID=A0A2K2HEM3_9BACT|nr:hypothetical protein C2E25_00520 [Geothermobacter hydrogeniphilus]
MRMLLTGPQAERPAGTIMGFFYFYFLLHWLTGFFMFFTRLGFTYDSVVRYYLGDPERFMNPRSFSGLLEVSHFHLFAMGLFFVVFSHLLLFTGFRAPFKCRLTWGLAGALLTDMASGWLVRYLAAEFAWLKLAAFWSVQGVSLVLLGGLLWEFSGRRSRRPLSMAPGKTGQLD